MITRIDLYDDNQNDVEKVYIWQRMGMTHWQGPNHHAALSNADFTNHVIMLLTYKPPPTPVERAKSIVQWFNDGGPAFKDLEQSITQAIKDAIAVDREAR